MKVTIFFGQTIVHRINLANSYGLQLTVGIWAAATRTVRIGLADYWKDRATLKLKKSLTLAYWGLRGKSENLRFLNLPPRCWLTA